jgi:hypothetical protein
VHHNPVESLHRYSAGEAGQEIAGEQWVPILGIRARQECPPFLCVYPTDLIFRMSSVDKAHTAAYGDITFRLSLCLEVSAEFPARLRLIRSLSAFARGALR